MTDALVPTPEAAAVAPHLDDLAAALRDAGAAPAGPGSHDREQADLLRLVERYARPRLIAPPGPLTAVVFGATGAGKSALVNALAGRAVASPGPLRPATHRAVAWIHYANAGSGRRGGATEEVVSDDPVVANVTVIDAPPAEVEAEGRTVVRDLLEVADLGIHVASAGRYADAAAWRQIEGAAERGLSLWFVLNRLPAAAEERRPVVADYAARLSAAGLLGEGDDVVAIPEEGRLAEHGGQSPEAVAPLAARLAALADDATAAALARQTLVATLRALARRSEQLAMQLDAGAASARELRAFVTAAYADQGQRLADLMADGRLPLRPAEHWDDEREDLTRLATRAAGAAAHEAAGAWSGHSAGAQLLAEQRSLWRHGPGTEDAAVEQVEAWHELVAAAARLRYPRWWSVRKRGLLAAALRHGVLRGRGDPRLQDHLGARAEATVAGLRSELSAALRAALAVDATRFTAIGGDPDVGAEQAAALAAAASELEGVVGS